jgi:hypothetical protein
MSEPIICEYCGSKSKTKNSLYIHQKGTARCIKMQVEKLGKPLYELKLENKKEKSKKEPKVEPKTEPKEESESESESEEDENQEIPFISTSEESDVDIQISESEEEVIKPKFSNAKLFKKKELTPKEEPRKEEPRNTEPRKSLKHPELMSEINNVKKEVDTKEIVSSILTALNSKDNKVLEEIKKLRDELKDRDEALRKTITKLEKTLNDCNPLSIIEIIKKIQAEVETKDDLLQIFKEDLEETLDKYYELYKKLKDVKYDMEDMVYGDKK